nr:KrmI [uncultured bacterium]
MHTPSFSLDTIELMALDSQSFVVRTQNDFVHVEGFSRDKITALLQALAHAATDAEIQEVFPEAGRPEGARLLRRLRAGAPSVAKPAVLYRSGASSKDEAAPLQPRSIVILGNGALAAALQARLREQGIGRIRTVCVRSFVSLNDASFTKRANELYPQPLSSPSESSLDDFACVSDTVMETANEPMLAEVMQGSELVVCALENTYYQAFIEVSKATHALGLPILFVTANRQTCMVGPLSIPGVTVTFREAYEAMFHKMAPSVNPEGFLAYVHAQSLDLAHGQAVLQFVEQELRTLLSPRPDSVLFGHLVELRAGQVSRMAAVLPVGTAEAYDGEAGWAELRHAAVLRLAVTDGACTSHRSDRQVPHEHTAIKSICVVGGGTAGYLSALTLRRRMPHLKISLLESSRVPIIGVGEATTPSLPALLHGVLDMDIVDFFTQVKPTFKMGIRFEWGGTTPEHYFNYPFGAHGQLLEAMTYQGHIRDYSLGSMLMSADKMAIFRTGDGAYESRLHYGAISYAYHIDNQRFVSWLQREAKRAGLHHIDANIQDVVTDDSGQNVVALLTDDGARHEYDFYVDCSGFRSLLLEKALDSEWVPYDQTLFTDRAVTANVPHGGHIKPYTVAETMDHGWCWNIPMREDDHRGYVFSSAFCDEETAIKEMQAKNPGMSDTKLVTFRSGRHRHFWKGNVVAIGNSYAFVEPLESTGVHMIAEEILAFIGNFPQSTHDDANRAALNRYMAAYWDELRWFLGLHFRFNTKLDTPFWKACRADVDVSGFDDCLATYRKCAPLSYRNHYLTFNRLWGDHGRDVLLMGQQVPANFLPPRESKQQWLRRVELARQAVEMAVDQAEAIRLLESNPDVLRQLVTDDGAWIHTVGELFSSETALYSDVYAARLGHMKKPAGFGGAQNVILPSTL